MNYSLLHQEYWNSLSDTERLSVTSQLAKDLPFDFVFRSLEQCTLGEQSHSVAFFDWMEDETTISRFALIPGANVTLGYDREKPFIPTPAQIKSWQETRSYYGGYMPDLAEFLNDSLTPRRVVSLNPILIETTLLDTESLDDTMAKYARLGFRLPTSDEWEWACGAGTKTLWRWGDYCPTDNYPSQEKDGKSPWRLHKQQNAFGLWIADDDYHQEFCESKEGRVIRGGNGGVYSCGGVGCLAAWLTLASSYVIKDEEMLEDLDEFNQGRRVFPLI